MKAIIKNLTPRITTDTDSAEYWKDRYYEILHLYNAQTLEFADQQKLQAEIETLKNREKLRKVLSGIRSLERKRLFSNVAVGQK